MIRPRVPKPLAAMAGVALAGVLVSAEPALRAGQEVEAAQIQFWLTSGGDGWECEGCCFTGFCCTIPVDACKIQPD
jgi:hypothetical protein